MKKLLAVLILGTLVACNTNTGENNANNDLQTKLNIEREEKLSVPISNIENIHYETILQTKDSSKKLYIEKLTEEKKIEDKTFENFIFYLVNEEENEAFIQRDISLFETNLPNIEKINFQTIEVKGGKILLAILPIDSDRNEIYALGLDNEELRMISFDGEQSTESLSSENLAYKELFREYIQTLTNNGKGYVFTSWKINMDQLNFTNYDQEAFTGDEEAIDVGGFFAERWQKFDDYFYDFPYYTFTEEDKDQLLKGRLIDLPHPLGTPIDQVIQDYTVYDEDYFDGGPYYETRDGMLFYDEGTNLHSVAFISGNRIKNAHEIEDILGKPSSSGRNDMYPDEKYSLYKYDDYALWLIYNDDNDLTRIELFSLSNR